MKAKLLYSGFPKTYAVVFDAGDEVLSGFKEFAREHDLTASQISGIGAFSDAVLGYFDWERKDYKRIPVQDQVEVVSLLGDVTRGADGPQVHIHAVLASSNARAFGGHLLEAHVRPTLELIVVESPSYLRRRIDPETGLPLIDLEVRHGASHR